MAACSLRPPTRCQLLLQARLAAVTAMLETQNSAVEQLRVDRDTANAEVTRLQWLIKQLTRSRYGAHSEKINPDQLPHALEEVAQSLGLAASVLEAAPAADKQVTNERKPQRNRGALPPHLPRVEVVVDIADKHCPCCGPAPCM
jgi:transposase